MGGINAQHETGRPGQIVSDAAIERILGVRASLARPIFTSIQLPAGLQQTAA
jgi:hypothetical protein